MIMTRNHKFCSFLIFIIQVKQGKSHSGARAMTWLVILERRNGKHYRIVTVGDKQTDVLDAVIVLKLDDELGTCNQAVLINHSPELFWFSNFDLELLDRAFRLTISVENRQVQVLI